MYIYKETFIIVLSKDTLLNSFVNCNIRYSYLTRCQSETTFVDGSGGTDNTSSQYDYWLKGEGLNSATKFCLPSFFKTESKTEKERYVAQKVKYSSSLRGQRFLILFPTRSKIVLASLSLRQTINETTYKVTETKSEIQSPQVLMNK